MDDISKVQSNVGPLYGHPEGEPLSLGVYLKAVWRRKWLVVFLIILITAAGAGYTYLQPPVYETTALLAFSARSPGAFNADVNERITGNFINTQIPLITRDAFLREIASDPELGLAKASMFQHEPDLVAALKRKLTVAPLKNTGILSISMEGEDAKLITLTVNRIADLHCARVESHRESSTAAAVQDHTKKMADMNSQMNAVTQKIWSRANSAAIPGLTFGEQQRDGHVIVEAFRRRNDSLLARRAETRKQLDQSAAEVAAMAIRFEALCESFLREGGVPEEGGRPDQPAAPPAPAPDDGARAQAIDGPAEGARTAAPAAPTAEAGPPEEKLVVLTAAELASICKGLARLESEIASARDLPKENDKDNPYVVTLQQRREKLLARLEDFRRESRMQQYTAYLSEKEQAEIRENVIKLNERIEQIEEVLEMRQLTLTPAGLARDPDTKLLQSKKASLEAEYEVERAKLDENADLLPQIRAEAPKIQQIEQGAADLMALRLTGKIQEDNLRSVQAELDALTAPLTDILNEAAGLDRLEQAYQRMDDWVRQVKLALSQARAVLYDATEPTVPIRPNWQTNIAFSGMLAVMVSFAVAMLLEMSRRTVKTTADVKQELALPLLGVVPHLPSLTARRGILSLDALRDPTVTETFGEIRFAIHESRGKNPPRTLLITSATAGEGKSTVSTLLAYSLARTGERVLLVDGNLRAPYLHAVFDCKAAPGLADILQERASGEACLHDTSVPNLFLLPAGPSSEDGLAWVQPEDFTEFVRAARETFDHVVFDTISTVGVTDVRVMACCVDAVIYVVQADRRKRALVSRGLQNIRNGKGNILGVILNDAHYTKGDHYHFLRRQIDRNGAVADGNGSKRTRDSVGLDKGNGKPKE